MKALNPTAVKARGAKGARISKAIETLGVDKMQASQRLGNAGGAMSAYCAKSAESRLPFVMPIASPHQYSGTEVHFSLVRKSYLIDGLIMTWAQNQRKNKKRTAWRFWPFLTRRSRTTGRKEKTMGLLKIAEQFDWHCRCDYFTCAGGGTGWLGYGKAFKEMKRKWGWIWKVPAKKMVGRAVCQLFNLGSKSQWWPFLELPNEYTEGKVPSNRLWLAVPQFMVTTWLMKVNQRSPKRSAISRDWKKI